MITLLPQTTKNPLQLIGTTAAVCWNAKTDDSEKNRQRALDCIRSGHGRVMEWVNVEVIVEGYSAKMMREAMRHIIGTNVLQASTRYIDYSKHFDVITPHSVKNNPEALNIWNKAIDDIYIAMNSLKELGVPKEDYTNLLPLAYSSKMIWKINLRALVHFFNQRMCNRAYWEIREFCNEIKNELMKYSEEWEYICKEFLVPKCEAVGYCTEKNSCNRMPKKNN